ncbi:MAG: energy transducer TonB [Pseudohongiellaceae bacterium]
MAQTDDELSNERFGFTVFLSACAHGILILGIGFSYLGESASEPVLEVTMAQYRSDVAPDDADFLAQDNQLGSGTLSEPAAPSTPFQSDFNADQINEVVPIPQAPRVDNQIEIQDTAVVSTFADGREVRQQLEEVEPEQQQPIDETASADDISLAIASLQAQLDRRRQEYASRPRRYTITSASTRRSYDAAYLDNWRRRIEAVGNLNYPDEARRNRVYGSLRMMVAIRPSGEVENIRILESSGHNLLDQAAVEIVSLAAPFEPFPEELRAEADILEIIRTWRFHEGDGLTSY